MNLRDHSEKLPVFIAVYENRNMRKAATVLNMSQPPLSYAIKQLESALDVELFIRGKRGVEPTAAADMLYDFAKKTLYEMEQVESELRNPRDKMSGLLTVGTYDSIARYFWPAIIALSAKTFPNLNLKLVSQRTRENIELLVSGEVDYCILVEPETTRLIEDVELKALYSDHYSFYSSTKKKSFQSNLIYVGGAFVTNTQSLDSFLLPYSKKYQEFKLDSFEVCREFIKKGIGIGVLPARVAQEDVRNNSIEKVSFEDIGKKGFGKHTIYECYKAGNRQKQKVDKFSKIVRTALKNPSP